MEVSGPRRRIHPRTGNGKQAPTQDKAYPSNRRNDAQPEGSAKGHGEKGAAEQYRPAQKAGGGPTGGARGPATKGRTCQSRQRVNSFICRAGFRPVSRLNIGQTMSRKSPSRHRYQSAKSRALDPLSARPGQIDPSTESIAKNPVAPCLFHASAAELLTVLAVKALVVRLL